MGQSAGKLPKYGSTTMACTPLLCRMVTDYGHVEPELLYPVEGLVEAVPVKPLRPPINIRNKR